MAHGMRDSWNWWEKAGGWAGPLEAGSKGKPDGRVPLYSSKDACESLGSIEFRVDVREMLGAFSFEVLFHLSRCETKASGSSPKKDYALASETIGKAL